MFLGLKLKSLSEPANSTIRSTGFLTTGVRRQTAYFSPTHGDSSRGGEDVSPPPLGAVWFPTVLQQTLNQ